MQNKKTRKKLTILVIIILTATLILAACRQTTPETEDPPTPEPTPETTQPQDTGTRFIGKLALNEIYYMHGDPDVPMMVFADDGVLESFTFTGEYNVIGDMVEIIIDGNKVDEMRIIDEYTILSEGEGIVFIREGGTGFAETVQPYNAQGIRILYFEQDYHLSGVPGQKTYRFHIGGGVTITEQGRQQNATFSVRDNEVTIYIDYQEAALMDATDAASFTNRATGEIFAVEGAFDRVIELGERYQLDGENTGEILRFFEDGTFSLENIFGEHWVGTYEMSEDGETIYADLDGEIAEIVIHNRYVIELDGEYTFIKIP